MSELLQRAKEMFSRDIYATQTTGIVIVDVRDNYAECELIVEDKHKNAADVVMGGAIFTLADFTFAVAANTGDALTVSLSSQISYLAPGRGKLLRAKADCRKNGKSACFYEVAVTDENDNLIAQVSVVGYRK